MSYTGQITLENYDLQIPCLKNFLDKIGDLISGHHHNNVNLNPIESEVINTDEEEEVMEPGSIINHDNSVQDIPSSGEEESQEEELIESGEDTKLENSEPVTNYEEDEEIWEPTPGLSATLITTPVVNPNGKIVQLPPINEEDFWEPAGFFQDDQLNNALSPVRLGSFTALLAAIMLGGLTVLGYTQAAEAEATYALLGAAFGSKILQRTSKSVN
ncbi:MAG: hypothetical protein EWV50_10090 [Microcystis aeruginosa Ma_MB_F_20061100_S20]|uniref:Uncharacterized protein n=1 Tax=Microcystis aeruginosa Ma_MB_F_20061100_S20D TaxID=2486253 RepID=A0A552EFE9_MICAE|nr:MAG: hypothetical protein EWV78_16050 [Microcystis aeruginosa Ma_MB_F_20061100_S20D]TRU39401.1 MAG: hypothetical protein EWV50_10090 [Microcystis aeruginosa Ma_MB_F_20061100_S20]